MSDSDTTRHGSTYKTIARTRTSPPLLPASLKPIKTSWDEGAPHHKFFLFLSPLGHRILTSLFLSDTGSNGIGSLVAHLSRASLLPPPLKFFVPFSTNDPAHPNYVNYVAPGGASGSGKGKKGKAGATAEHVGSKGAKASKKQPAAKSSMKLVAEKSKKAAKKNPPAKPPANNRPPSPTHPTRGVLAQRVTVATSRVRLAPNKLASVSGELGENHSLRECIKNSSKL